MSIDRFALPVVLVLLAGLPLIAWLIRRAGRRGAVAYAPMSRLGSAGRSVRARLCFAPSLLRVLAMAALLVAIARPQAVSGESRTTTRGVALELVIDRSGSMEEPMRVAGRSMSKLEAVKMVVRDFVLGDSRAGADMRGRSGDLVGVIEFGSYADTICPLVRDTGAVAELIEDIQIPRRNDERGTAIGEALALAAARLRDAESEIAGRAGGDAEASGFIVKGKVVILLTDGVNSAGQIDPLAAAGLAAQWGIRVYTIGVGGDGQRGRGVFGNLRLPGGGLDERTLGAIAEATGGKFFVASDERSLREIYSAIDELERTEIDTVEFTNADELFPPLAQAAGALLAAELLLSMTVFRRLP
jgi:Ca-activated chloride channel family protein